MQNTRQFSSTANSQVTSELAKLQSEIESARVQDVRVRALKKYSGYALHQDIQVSSRVTAYLEQVFTELNEDLQNIVVNAAYDMAEDEERRHQGIRFITSLSKLNPESWTKRNVDVIIQLLELDEPKDLEVLYDALAEHIKVEPEATLHILCSFLSKNTREGGSSFVELRRKIITCLVTRDAKNVVMNDVNSTMASELRDTLLQLISRVSTSELAKIVHDLLLPFPHPERYTYRLIETLLAKSKAVLASNATDPSVFPLEDVVTISEAAYAVYTRSGKLFRERLLLLNFYSSPAMLAARPKVTPKPTEWTLVQRLAESLDIPTDKLNGPENARYKDCRDRVADDCVAWIRVLNTSQDRLWGSAVPLLRIVYDKRREDTSWSPDAGAFQRLTDKLGSQNLPASAYNEIQQAKLLVKDIKALVDGIQTDATKAVPIPSHPALRPPARAAPTAEKRKATEFPAETPQITGPHATNGVARQAQPRPLKKNPVATKTTPLLARLSLGDSSITSPVTQPPDSERPTKRPKRASETSTQSAVLGSAGRSLLARMNGVSIASPLSPSEPIDSKVNFMEVDAAEIRVPPRELIQRTAVRKQSATPTVSTSTSQQVAPIAAKAFSIRGAAASPPVANPTQAGITAVAPPAANFAKTSGLSIKGAASGTVPTSVFGRAIGDISRPAAPLVPKVSFSAKAAPNDNRPSSRPRNLLSRMSDSGSVSGVGLPHSSKPKLSLADRLGATASGRTAGH